MILTQWTLSLPDWILEWQKEHESLTYASEEARLELAIDLSLKNVEHGTGGPFGAVIFDDETGEIFALGVNRVVPQHCAIAHAETMAIMAAQQKAQNYTLNTRKYHLASSAQPCAMCCGAVAWSGLSRLTFAATKEDVEENTGFDEGPLHPHWDEELKRRGIQSTGGLLREKAVTVFHLYIQNNGKVYNGKETKLIPQPR